MNSHLSSHPLRFLILSYLLFAFGCEGDQIRTYDAPKMKIQERPAVSAAPAAPAKPMQMLAAMLPQGEKTWFFKLTAPPAEAAAAREAFGKFVASTRFEDGKPSWEIPSEWIEEPGRPMRFTTYRIGPGGPEVSISELPSREDRAAYELENVNRWRNQLGLPPIDQDAYDNRELPEAEGEIVSISTPAGDAILLDLVGEMAPSGSGPPFAGPMMGPAMRPSPAVGGGGSKEPKFTAPDHWQPGVLNSFRILAFEVAEESETAEITVSTAGGDLLNNINRWRMQVDLPPWTLDDIKMNLKLLTVDDEPAGYVQLVGPAETILGVILQSADQTWFVKLTGPNKIAAKEQTNFENFVESLKF